PSPNTSAAPTPAPTPAAGDEGVLSRIATVISGETKDSFTVAEQDAFVAAIQAVSEHYVDRGSLFVQDIAGTARRLRSATQQHSLKETASNTAEVAGLEQSPRRRLRTRPRVNDANMNSSTAAASVEAGRFNRSKRHALGNDGGMGGSTTGASAAQASGKRNLRAGYIEAGGQVHTAPADKSRRLDAADAAIRATFY
ncbi:unnamed protein product, partial [Chrysoparadoxa australica]